MSSWVEIGLLRVGLRGAQPNLLLVSDYSLPLDSTTPDLIVSAIGAGLYSISMFGQTASEIGAYSLDYSIEINVSAVPVPAAAWLFGSGLLGLVSIARRRRSA